MALRLYQLGAIYYKICIDSYEIHLLYRFSPPLRMALAGTMAFIAGTTCLHRITVRHIILVLTLINFTHTQCQWAVIRCMPATILQMCTKLTYYMPEPCEIIKF